jgi:large repetitive protein
MKSPYISIKLAFIFTAICGLSCFLSINKSFSQGFNNNEWIFGYCGSSEENSYLSFGKGGDPIVRTIPGSIVVGADNNAIAIDPITGQKLFYTNGELVYNFDDQIIQGAPNGIDGDFTGRQTVAISALNYDPNGVKLFYSFYVSPSGQLLYSVIDMDAPGGATGNQPPLGEVTALDLNIGTASGAIAVVKSVQSASYLISFSGGELIARRIEPTQGDFTQTDTEGIPFSPKSIIYQESDGKLLLIPENPNDDLIVLDFDSGSGSFGSQTSITASGGPDGIEGAAFSPDGGFVYFSQGDDLKRVPVSDLGSTPETVELDSGPFKVYDVKIGPDGKLYYLYEEVNGGPQLMGVVNNPDEADLDLIEVEEDPFNGTDFCGRIFPQFAPNQDIDATVDFIWNPTDPCSNNPIQLTSLVSPENFRPVSFEWTFDPPLTDEDGDPVDIDFNQEHLLIPADATGGQSVTVTLTVTFADGTTLPVTKTLILQKMIFRHSSAPRIPLFAKVDAWILALFYKSKKGEIKVAKIPIWVGAVKMKYMNIFGPTEGMRVGLVTRIIAWIYRDSIG